MLRFDDCLCGTTTTGAGPLTLAATPNAIGGIDPDVWARATGVGFGNAAVLLIDYVLTEYTDSTFATEKQKERGIGTLTLGGSAGIANCTLARTTVIWTASSLNSQPATATPAGTAITIGTAANCLVAITPSANGVLSCAPYVDNTAAGDQLGLLFPWHNSPGTALGGSFGVTGNQDYYAPFPLLFPLIVKKASLRIAGAGASNTGTIWARIFDVGTDGRPGRCLVDFGQVGGANALQSTGNVSSTALTNGALLPPGVYFFAFIVSSALGSPTFAGPNTTSTGKGAVAVGPMGSTGAAAYCGAQTTAASGTTGAVAPGTAANLTGYAGITAAYYFWLSP